MSEEREKWPRDHPQHKLNHPSFPQPLDTSTKVWRYFDLPKFVWLLEHKELFFPPLNMLVDPHEGASTKRYVELMNDLFAKQEHGERLLEKMREYSRDARKTVHVNCWNMGESESEAMWRLYCPNSQGVAIQTTYEKLVESVDDDPQLFIGCVIYLDYETEALSQGNVFDPVMQKRLSFSHEREVRLVKSISLDEAESKPNGISIKWPVEKTIEHIYIDPYAPPYFEDVVRSIVSRYEPVLEKRVCWSRMRATPLY